MTHATFSIPPLSSLNGDVTAWVEGAVPTSEVTMSKTGNESTSGKVDLSQVFQYGMTNGFPQLINALTDLTFALHGKPYEEAKLYLSVGSLDSEQTPNSQTVTEGQSCTNVCGFSLSRTLIRSSSTNSATGQDAI